jgi:alcohol dehydrogenase
MPIPILQTGTQVFSEIGCASFTGEIVTQLEKKALIITESIHHESKLIEKIREVLSLHNVDCILFDEINPQSDSQTVQNSINLAMGSKPPLIIGMGGVKALSIAKHTAAVLGNQQTEEGISHYLPHKQVIYGEIPTTFNHPLLFSNKYFIWDEDEKKMSITQIEKSTHFAILDPNLAIPLSDKFKITTLLHMIMFNLEGSISSKNNYFSKENFYKSGKMILNLMESIKADFKDKNLLFQCVQSGFYTSLGISTTLLGIGGIASNLLGAYLKVPMSWIGTILIQPLIQYYWEKNQDLLKPYLMDIFEVEDDSSRQLLMDFVEKEIGSNQLPTRLSDISDQIPSLVDISEEIAHGYFNIHHETIDKKEIQDILKSVL